MVGPTTAELESINELIKFDHIYYKPQSGGFKNSVNGQGEVRDIVMSVPVAAQPIANQPEHLAQPAADDVVTATNQKLSSIVTAVDPQLGLGEDVNINDLLGLTSQSWMDLDALLQGELNATSEDTVTTVTNTATVATSNIDSGFSVVSKDKSVPALNVIRRATPGTKTSLLKRKRKSDEPINLAMAQSSLIPDSQLLSPTSLLNFESLSHPGSLSESGYSSGHSDIGSPRSDISSALGDDLWEDSFTQLFPSLV
jgi:hypothetical protein